MTCYARTDYYLTERKQCLHGCFFFKLKLIIESSVGEKVYKITMTPTTGFICKNKHVNRDKVHGVLYRK